MSFHDELKRYTCIFVYIVDLSVDLEQSRLKTGTNDLIRLVKSSVDLSIGNKNNSLTTLKTVTV